MSDSFALHSTILERVRQANPHEDLRRQKVFAWLVVGLLLEQTICLPHLANVMVSVAKAASRERRLQRFLSNSHVKVRAYYDALIRQALMGWTDDTLYLVIDTTSLAGRLVIGRIAVVSRGRALPLVWQVYQRQSVALAYVDDRALLEHAVTLLPTGRGWYSWGIAAFAPPRGCSFVVAKPTGTFDCVCKVSNWYVSPTDGCWPWPN